MYSHPLRVRAAELGRNFVINVDAILDPLPGVRAGNLGNGADAPVDFLGAAVEAGMIRFGGRPW